MSETTSNARTVSRDIGYTLGVFAAIGIGVGLTGGVIATQVGGGSAIVSGILMLVVVSVALLFGPVIGGYLGAQRRGVAAATRGYLVAFVTSAVGYLVMMGIVLLCLVAALALTGGGGGTSTSAASGASGSSGGGLDVGRYLLPVVLVAIPTGLTTVVTSALSGWAHTTDSTAAAQGTGVDIDRRYVVGAVVGIVLLSGAAIAGATVLQPSSQIELTEASGYTTTSAVFAEMTVENAGGAAGETTVTAQLLVDDSVVQESVTRVDFSVDPDGTSSETVELVSATQMTRSQIEAIVDGDWTIEFLIDGETQATHDGAPVS